MYTVYILESLSRPDQHYVGFTEKHMELRLQRHNEGTTPATKRYRPWKLVWSSAFPEKEMALTFETYLKSGSGRAFANKRLIPSGS